MHVIKCLDQMVKLWRNSQYVNHQANISINFDDDVDSSPMQKYNTGRQCEVRDWGMYIMQASIVRMLTQVNLSQ